MAGAALTPRDPDRSYVLHKQQRADSRCWLVVSLSGAVLARAAKGALLAARRATLTVQLKDQTLLAGGPVDRAPLECGVWVHQHSLLVLV
jgi:hypothetical protein